MISWLITDILIQNTKWNGNKGSKESCYHGMTSLYHCRHHSTQDPQETLRFITFKPPKPQGSKRFQLISHISMVNCGRNQSNRLSSDSTNKIEAESSNSRTQQMNILSSAMSRSQGKIARSQNEPICI